MSTKKIKKPKAPVVKLISFTITAIIPTEPYGNIQPAITVQAGSIEDAKAVVLPHIDALMARYSVNAPKSAGIMAAPKDQPAPSKESTAKDPVAAKEPAVEGSEPFQKGLTAIKTAYSITALDLIDDKIIFSKKLTDGEKLKLKPFVEAKRKELKGDMK